MTHLTDFLWKRPEWPSFYWSNSALTELLVQTRFIQGQLLALPSSFVHSYEMSDTKKHLYEDLLTASSADATALTDERLRGWQASLYPTGYAGVRKVRVGEFRDQNLLNLKTEFLPPELLKEEIPKYLTWWKEAPAALDPVLRSGLAFFWFYLLSPFEAGNLEIAAALAELSLQENEKTSLRYYDIAIQLEENRDEIERLMQASHQENGDITTWMQFYLQLYLEAVQASFAIADKDFSVERFWARHSELNLNARQRQILNSMLLGESEMTNRRYVELCETSRESAKRDLAELVKLGLLQIGNKKGRSVSYSLANLIKA
ncbi:DUF4172 domain-containing protein [Pseudobdellovibrio exovorus]|nr:DUF4172 domain-containing protein [Pseudobdellovibrio exovorus]